jgi:hypothetical protein
MPTTNRPFWHSRWWMPGFSVFLGLLILGAAWIGDNRGEGLFGLAVMVALALVFVVFGRRSDTLAGLGGPGRDERWQAIDVAATALAGSVLVAVIIGAWLVELAKGEDGEPYSQLGAVGGIAYILAVAVLRRRG